MPSSAAHYAAWLAAEAEKGNEFFDNWWDWVVVFASAAACLLCLAVLFFVVRRKNAQTVGFNYAVSTATPMRGTSPLLQPASPSPAQPRALAVRQCNAFNVKLAPTGAPGGQLGGEFEDDPDGGMRVLSVDPGGPLFAAGGWNLAGRTVTHIDDLKVDSMAAAVEALREKKEVVIRVSPEEQGRDAPAGSGGADPLMVQPILRKRPAVDLADLCRSIALPHLAVRLPAAGLTAGDCTEAALQALDVAPLDRAILLSALGATTLAFNPMDASLASGARLDL